MNFWDTILGHDLARVLIRELPKLTAPKKQQIETLKESEVAAYINQELHNGKMFVSYIPAKDESGKVSVIMEKV